MADATGRLDILACRILERLAGQQPVLAALYQTFRPCIEQEVAAWVRSLPVEQVIRSEVRRMAEEDKAPVRQRARRTRRKETVIDAEFVEVKP